MLQMAQIILFISSVASDSLHITANRHRGTMQQISASVCIMKMQQRMTMLIWATNDVIMSKLNTKSRPRNMFTPCLHSSDAWNELGNALHKFSLLYFFFFSFLTYQASTRRYRACVIWRLQPSGSEIMLMSLPGSRFNYWIHAAGCRLHCIYLSCTISI